MARPSRWRAGKDPWLAYSAINPDLARPHLTRIEIKRTMLLHGSGVDAIDASQP